MEKGAGLYKYFNSIHPAFLKYLVAKIRNVHQISSFNYSPADHRKYTLLHITCMGEANQSEYTAHKKILAIRELLNTDEMSTLKELSHLIFLIDNHLSAAKKLYRRRRSW